MRGILNRKRHKGRHNFLCQAYALVCLLLGIGAFIGIITYIVFLFYYRKFDELPQWVIKVFVPKTADGGEVLIKFTENKIKTCNLIFLIINSLTGILAIVSWILFSSKRGKVKSTLLVASYAISLIGGFFVALKLGMSLWLKITFTAIGSVGWFILFPFSMGDTYEEDMPLWVYAVAMAMIDFTTSCWVYAGAANWWC